MQDPLRRAFCAAVDWLVFQAPRGEYKEHHEPEGCTCHRRAGPLLASVYYCQVLEYQVSTLAADIWDYAVSLRVAVGPDRDCAFTGLQCFRVNMRSRIPIWLKRRYRYTKNRIGRYLIPSTQYSLTKVGLARCPNCGERGCDGNCVPF